MFNFVLFCFMLMYSYYFPTIYPFSVHCEQVSFDTFMNGDIDNNDNDGQPPKKRRKVNSNSNSNSSNSNSNSTSKRSSKSTSDRKSKSKSNDKKNSSKTNKSNSKKKVDAKKGKTKDKTTSENNGKSNKDKDQTKSKSKSKSKTKKSASKSTATKNKDKDKDNDKTKTKSKSQSKQKNGKGKEKTKDKEQTDKDKSKDKHKSKEKRKSKQTTSKNTARVSKDKDKGKDKNKDKKKDKEKSKVKSNVKNKDKKDKNKDIGQSELQQSNQISRKRAYLYKPLNQYNVSDLKHELTKLGLSTKGKKKELFDRFFQCVRLLPYEIDTMDKSALQKEFELRRELKGLGKWDRDDLAHYLKYRNRSIHDFGNFYSSTHIDNEKKEEEHYKQLFSRIPQLTRDEFDKIPLFRIQDYFGSSRGSHRNKLFKTYCEKLQEKAEEKAKDDKLVEPIVNHFFENGDLSKRKRYLSGGSTSNSNSNSNSNGSGDNCENSDKFVIFHDLPHCERYKIRTFAEENGLITVSLGEDDKEFKKVIGVGRKCDNSELWECVNKANGKYDKIRKERKDAVWQKVVNKHNHVKAKILSDRSDNNDNGDSKHNSDWNVDGKWEIPEYFNYRTHDLQGYSNCYVKFFKQRNENMKNVIYGRFEIGEIEDGRIKIKDVANINNNNRKFTISWRGRESGTSEIILGKKTGTIEFDDYGTKLKCCLNSACIGKFNFSAIRVSSDETKRRGTIGDAYSDSELEDEREELMHEKENSNRWR